MLLETWSDVLTQSFQNLWLGVIGYVPQIVVAVLIFVLGWVLGSVLGKVVAQGAKMARLDTALTSAGAGDLLSRAGWHLDSGAFLGTLVKWFFIIAFLVASFDVLGLSQVNEFLSDVVLGYLPNVIVAALVLVVAAVVADVAEKLVMGSARAAGMMHTALYGAVVRWSVWIFAVIVALAHLGVAPQFMQILFTGIVVMLSLAGGLAFGLGGRDAAARFIEEVRSDLQK